MTERRYSREEVASILRVALDQADDVEGLTQVELREVADEVGIPIADLDSAIEMLEREREVLAEMEKIRAGRKGRLYRSLGNLAIVGSTATAIDFMLGPEWFVQYLFAMWGMVAAFQARSAFLPNEARLESQARKTLARRWRKQQWRKREKELPKVVEAGAAALVEAAARKIAERIEGGAAGGKRSASRVRVDPRPATTARSQATTTEEEEVLAELEELRRGHRR